MEFNVESAFSGKTSTLSPWSLMTLRMPRMLIFSLPKYSSAGATLHLAGLGRAPALAGLARPDRFGGAVRLGLGARPVRRCGRSCGGRHERNTGDQSFQ